MVVPRDAHPDDARDMSELAAAFGELATGPDASTFRRPPGADDGPPPPAEIRATAGAMVAMDRIGVPPALLAALKHLASLHNPEFHEKEKLRFSTWGTPRLIRCYRETLDRLLLPRGLRDRAESLVREPAAGSWSARPTWSRQHQGVSAASEHPECCRPCGPNTPSRRGSTPPSEKAISPSTTASPDCPTTGEASQRDAPSKVGCQGGDRVEPPAHAGRTILMRGPSRHR